MAPSTAEAFVLQMVHATLSPSGIAYIEMDDVGKIHQIWIEAKGGDDRRRKGKLILTLTGKPAGDVVIEYEVTSNDAGWSQGTCSVGWDSLPKCRKQYFCEWNEEDETLEVWSVGVMHRRRALNIGLSAVLDDLGHRRSADAVERRLTEIGYSPDVNGLRQYIGYIFDIMACLFRMEQADSTWRYEVSGARSDDWGVYAEVTDLPSGILALASKFHDQVVDVPLGSQDD